MNVSPCRCFAGLSVTIWNNCSRADDVGQQRVADDERQREEDRVLAELSWRALPAVQGALSRARCWCESPSMRYSILRKTISISTVCGQVQPHQSRPKAAVNMMMPVTKISRATAKMIMSCGQKIWPRMTNLRSTMLISSSGLPLMRTNGPANMTASSSQLSHVRARKNRPLRPCAGKATCGVPSWSAVARWSRKSAQSTLSLASTLRLESRALTELACSTVWRGSTRSFKLARAGLGRRLVLRRLGIRRMRAAQGVDVAGDVVDLAAA